MLIEVERGYTGWRLFTSSSMVALEMNAHLIDPSTSRNAAIASCRKPGSSFSLSSSPLPQIILSSNRAFPSPAQTRSWQYDSPSPVFPVFSDNTVDIYVTKKSWLPERLKIVEPLVVHLYSIVPKSDWKKTKQAAETRKEPEEKHTTEVARAHGGSGFFIAHA